MPSQAGSPSEEAHAMLVVLVILACLLALFTVLGVSSR
jgi:hypothetical protein